MPGSGCTRWTRGGAQGAARLEPSRQPWLPGLEPAGLWRRLQSAQQLPLWTSHFLVSWVTGSTLLCRIMAAMVDKPFPLGWVTGSMFLCCFVAIAQQFCVRRASLSLLPGPLVLCSTGLL